MAEVLTQLIPVDVAKSYPQWGTEVKDAAGNVIPEIPAHLREP